MNKLGTMRWKKFTTTLEQFEQDKLKHSLKHFERDELATTLKARQTHYNKLATMLHMRQTR